MADSNTVAIISVVSSATVIVVASATQVWLAGADRRHERGMAVEQRLWEDKSAMLLSAATYALNLRRLLTEDYEGKSDPTIMLPLLIDSRRRLRGELAPAVALYGSDTTRDLLGVLDSTLRNLDLDNLEAWRALWIARRDKETQIDVQDFEKAAAARAEEKDLLSDVGLPQHPIDLLDILDRLVGSLRAEIWQPVRSRDSGIARSARRLRKSIKQAREAWSLHRFRRRLSKMDD